MDLSTPVPPRPAAPAPAPPAGGREPGAASAAAEDGPARHIAIRHGRDILLRALAEVRCLRSQGRHTQVLLAGEEGLLPQGITAVQAQLPPGLFAEVYRGVLVNLALVQRIRRDELGRMLLYLHGRAEPVQVARAQEARFRAGLF